MHNGGGDAHGGVDARSDRNLIGTTMICGTVIGAIWMVVRSWDKNSREWQESIRLVGDFFQSLRFGHKEDIQERGPFWRQWGRFVSTIRGGTPPNARDGVHSPQSVRGDADSSRGGVT